jgi:hypothetical protein
MRKYILLATIALFVGCSEKPCPCSCPNCGVECRNRCEEERCIIGEKCCDRCDCPEKKPIKLPEEK